MIRALIGGGTLVLAACLVVGAVAEPPRGAPARFAANSVELPAGAAAGAPAAGEPEPAGAVVPVAGESQATPTLPATAPQAEPAAQPAPAAGSTAPMTGDAALVDPGWASAVAVRTGIPVRAAVAYAGAALRLRAEQPSCHLGWNTLAALGEIESAHGTHGASGIDEGGTARPPIFGPDLDGNSYANIPDSDGGALDGSSGGDRAMGPLQFIPSTWQSWGADGNGDGVADPQQLDDAALAAGHYLCSYGDLSTVSGWRASVFAYNHLDTYVDAVARTANTYSAQAG
ncbi:hypothetical protein B7R54_14785 [Subtercola boreus]|uniref:Transglycosylase SLT domain-containing protein n=1 Tax=Subtercola boreus TaxID=120213 RepID=A0A3E0VK40_9MICO|nr:lytic transglycosylase domain-containing protein [Subtercola boreus]RFA10334.1 hypothetical protein B7R54_14785 [Subtercola boreus]TQL56158.1 membrane-bound lytic murein transglycosylase B [Subtercola boreus]